MWEWNHSIYHRAVGRSENPGVPVLFGGHNLSPLVEIGLTDLPVMRWQGHYLINIILRSSPLLIAWILDLIALTIPLVDLTDDVDNGLVTAWSAAGWAVYTVGLWCHGIPERNCIPIWCKVHMVFWRNLEILIASKKS